MVRGIWGGFVAYALSTFLGVFSPIAEAAPSKAPHVVVQVQMPDGARYILVRNPLPKSVHVYFECENALSTQPVTIQARRKVTVQLRATDPIEGDCTIVRWEVAKGRRS